MSQPVKIVAVLTALPGQTEALEALLNDMLAPSRAEPGNLRYDLWRDRADNNRFVLDELYLDVEAAAAHRATPHFQAYLSAIPSLADRSAFTLDPIA
ncbi:MAG: putative quinol monooxygenase [Nocardioides sp.]